jgi:glycosyltransferase involved in cell wall biosynthesis
MILLWAGVALTSACFILLVQVFGASKLKCLDQVSGEYQTNGDSLPLLSVVIPACNEADNIRATVADLLTQQYPHVEVILINDRSTDSTGAIIDELSQKYPQVRKKHIETLPDNWLGKNHALQIGAAMADGEFLLFTDADVRFEQTTLARAMRWVGENRLDHLTLLFRNTTRGGLLNALIVEAMTGLLMVFQPWNVRKQKKKFFIGIGAFNLVRKSCYQAIGGHAANKMHPIDDIILGKTIHDKGLRQDCLRGESFVTVDWYSSTQDMINGLMKNVYCFYNYNVFYAVSAALLIIIFSLAPYGGIFFTEGFTRQLFLATVVIKGAVFTMNATTMKQPLYYVLWQPLAVCLLLYISLKATIRTHMNGGITWRGTFYPLQKLRQAQPIITLQWFIKPVFLRKH